MQSSREYVRRVQLVGGSTLTIALPKEWALENRVTKGSELRITVLPGGGLLVEPLGRTDRKSSEWNARVVMESGNYSGVLRRVVSYYVAGARVIDIVYDERSAREAEALAEQLRSILLGVEVLESEPGKISLYAVLDNYSVGFWDAYMKMRRAVIGMIESLEAAARSGDRGLAAAIVRRDDIVDRLYLYLVRQLTTSLIEGRARASLGLSSPAEAPHLFLAMKSLERIGDHITIISSILGKAGPALLRERLEQVAETRRIVSEASKLVKEPDPGLANSLANAASRLRKTLSSARLEGPLWAVVSSLARINGYAQDILEASIDIQTIRSRVGGQA